MEETPAARLINDDGKAEKEKKHVANVVFSLSL